MSLKNGKDYLYLIWKCPTSRRHYLGCGGERIGKYLRQYCNLCNGSRAEIIGVCSKILYPGFWAFYGRKRLDKCYISNVEKQTHCDVCVSVTVKIDGKQS